MNNPQRFWDDVYGSKSATEVSWYQPRPEQSLKLIRSFAKDHSSRIIDVGCGASTLVGELAAEGYSDLTALDTSSVAIRKARSRLGEAADRIAWIVADVTQWSPDRHWDLWHDRAVFHFLTEPEAQSAYLHAMSAALVPGASAIIATFALDGPERCSGLPVQRYSATSLAARLGPSFRLLADAAESHVTPKGATQRFVYTVFERL